MSKELSYNLFLTGTVTATTPLTVTPPGDLYKATENRPSRLPRLNPNAPVKENQQPYYPASGFLGWLRRALTRDVMAHLPEQTMPAEVYYLLASGGAEGFEAGSMLEIGRKQTLRTRNPAESTFGSFRLAAKLGAGNLYPHNEALVPPFLGGVRTNDAVRTPELIEGFDEQSRQRIFERLMIDRGASLDRKDHKDALNAVKKAARNAQKAGNREEAERLYEEVAQLEEGFKVDGDKHVPIQNLFSGYEYFPEGTAFDHRLSLTGASIEDVGTTLAALRAGAAQPRLGGHWHHDCGWVRTEYTIKIKPTGDYGPATIAGRLIIDPIDGFELDSDDPLLLKALDIYDRQAQAGFPDWSGMREGSGLTALNKVPKKGNGKADKTEAA